MGGEVRTGAKVSASERSDRAWREAAKGGNMPGESVAGAAGPLPAVVRPAASKDMLGADMAVCGGIPYSRGHNILTRAEIRVVL